MSRASITCSSRTFTTITSAAFPSSLHVCPSGRSSITVIRWGTDRMTTRAFEAYAAGPRRESPSRAAARGPAAARRDSGDGGQRRRNAADDAARRRRPDQRRRARERRIIPRTEPRTSARSASCSSSASFRFLALGDLSGNTLTRLVCPRNLLGDTTVYLVSHHGDYDTNVPALYAALRPQAAIMNNGITKGGSPDALKTVARVAGPRTICGSYTHQRNARAVNSPDPLIANVDEGTTGYALRLTAFTDGSYRIVNERTASARPIPPEKPAADGSLTVVGPPLSRRRRTARDSVRTIRRRASNC